MEPKSIPLTDKLAIEAPELLCNLPKLSLFQAALWGDRGRTRLNGTNDERKAYQTLLKDKGPIVFLTDPECTGRPVNDTFAVAWPEVESDIWWKSSFKRYDPDLYERLLERIVGHINDNCEKLYVIDRLVGQDSDYSVSYKFVGEYATHAIFSMNMFLPLGGEAASRVNEKWIMLNIQSFRCVPERDGCHSDKVAVIDFRNRICLVAGQADYCGLVKKLMFTVMNFLLPKHGILPMHSAANLGPNGDSAVLFGLSGTGKTTLSADLERQLVGDDEIGWTDSGVFNLEDGCYAKLIDLDKEAEPVIASALSKWGTVIENVPPLPGITYELTHPNELNLHDNSRTENTRFSYPLSCVPNVAPDAKAEHPETIVLLTADAYGVLPPVSVLELEEVMYYFLQGFTARLAGTEIGVTQPEAVFSPCFGAPFMSQMPVVYAKLLEQKLKIHKPKCILLNTGWFGGTAGEASRVPINATRSMLRTAISGKFHEKSNGIAMETHPIFGLRYPTACPEVDPKIMNPKNAWRDPDAYDKAAKLLRSKFRDNFQSKKFGDFGIRAVV